MKGSIQANYEERLSRYVTLIQGAEPPGLVPKLAVYRELLRQHSMHGDRLWKIEPVLHPLIFAAETDLYLATARLLEEPRRAEGSLFAFLHFCMKNQANITWMSIGVQTGPPIGAQKGPPLNDGRTVEERALRCARRREGGARPEARAAQSIF